MKLKPDPNASPEYPAVPPSVPANAQVSRFRSVSARMRVCEGVVDPGECVGRTTGCTPEKCEIFASRVARLLVCTRMAWNLPKRK